MHVLYFMAMRETEYALDDGLQLRKPCTCTSVPQVKQQQQQINNKKKPHHTKQNGGTESKKKNPKRTH